MYVESKVDCIKSVSLMDINHCFSLDLSSLESIRLPLILIIYRSFIISCSSALNLDFSLYFSRSMLNVYLIMSVDFLWFGIWWTRFYISSSEEVGDWSFDFDKIDHGHFIEMIESMLLQNRCWVLIKFDRWIDDSWFGDFDWSRKSLIWIETDKLLKNIQEHMKNSQNFVWNWVFDLQLILRR